MTQEHKNETPTAWQTLMLKLRQPRWMVSALILAVVLGGLLGWWLFAGSGQDHHGAEMVQGADVTQVWTCSMHPQIRQPEPGQCPICGMDLIPVGGGESVDPGSVYMTSEAMRLADVQTMRVDYAQPVKTLLLNGKIEFDERKQYSQVSHIPGRIEQLNVNFTGERVERGEVIASIYSPELIVAQEELIETMGMKEEHRNLYRAARQKLLNLKLTEAQVDRIEQQGRADEEFPITADVSGVVVDQRVRLGDHVNRGTILFTVSDLSRVWVMLDVYESDLPWISVGDEVTVTVPALSDKQYSGKVSFIDPVIDPVKRVTRARVELENRGNRLLPEMLVTGKLKARLEGVGTSLVIPKSAVLWTGERSVVYVKHASSQRVGFKMRVVELGPSLGGSYIVRSGLEVGEEISVNGTFSVDAAAQLNGLPSMMSQYGGAPPTHHHEDGMSTPSSTVGDHTSEMSLTASAARDAVGSYLKISEALANDDETAARAALQSMKGALQSTARSTDQAHAASYASIKADVLKQIAVMESTPDIDALRTAFSPLSKQVVQLVESVPTGYDHLFLMHCPMAVSDDGADWISTDRSVRNPYFGASMLTCGDVTRKLKGP